MTKILINDGIHATGKKMLEDAGYEVETNKIPQEELPNRLNDFNAICVRSATTVRKDLIDLCPNLKVIARGGVGLDNIDVDYAKSKGLEVYNTPAASSRSVAELAFSHIFSLSRFLYKSNRNMPTDGDSEFKTLKKSFSKGSELKGKTIGIIGFGRIGQETAKIALGLGMDVLPVDPYMDKASINCARGGTIDEDALLAALDSDKVSAVGLDVFVNEPTPRIDLLQHPSISLTPHIGASTLEAQENIGIELAEKLIKYFS